MKRHIFRPSLPAKVFLFLALIIALSLVTLPVRAEFTRQVSITGGSPAKKLTTMLAVAGYTGNTQLDEITMCVPSANVNSMYLGNNSSVNAATGYEMAPGDCLTFRAAARPADIEQMFFYVQTTEKLAVTLRQR